MVECLKEANNHAMKSIAFPTLGLGALHFPAHQSAKLMAQGLREFNNSHHRITIGISKVIIFVYSEMKDSGKIQTVSSVTYILVLGYVRPFSIKLYRILMYIILNVWKHFSCRHFLMNWQASQVIFVLIVFIIWFRVKWKGCKIKDSFGSVNYYNVKFSWFLILFIQLHLGKNLCFP